TEQAAVSDFLASPTQFVTHLLGLISAPLSIISVSFFFFLLIPRPPRSTLLSLHDALPILRDHPLQLLAIKCLEQSAGDGNRRMRSEEHTSELQSRGHLVCRLLLEKKNPTYSMPSIWCCSRPLHLRTHRAARG